MNDMSADIEQEAPAADPAAFVQAVTQSQNLAAELDEQQLTQIASDVIDEYEMDKDSMSDWFERMERGVKLAKLMKEDKTFPWPGASNVHYPLITSAALQFNARAYPAIVPSDQAVLCRTYGADVGGKKAARGKRVSAHMSYQLYNQIEEWEESTDKLLVQLPIVGTMVRKWWFDTVSGRPMCRLVQPGKFIVNDRVKSLADAPRCSEEIDLYPAEIRTREMTGQYVEIDYEQEEDRLECQEFIEQHTQLDLDEDGYAEPYIVTVHKETKKVVRLVADFEPEDVKFETRTAMVEEVGPAGFVTAVPQQIPTRIVSIRRGSYFQAFHFLPSLDGGFHGTGLGLLLGDITEAIDSIINMMLDAGSFAALGGGFIGSNFRMKGGAQRMRPGEYRMAGETGANIRDGIVELTRPKPDAVLFQMLGLLIDAGREIASVKDIMTGDSGKQAQTATTTIALIEQGMMVFTAAYKRIYRSLKGEYKLLAKMNAGTVDPQTYNAFHDEIDRQTGEPIMFDPAQDYAAADMDICPVADPRSVTKMQEAAKAQLLREMAAEGMAAPGPTAQRIFESMEIDNTEELIPQPNPMQQEMEILQVEAARGQVVKAQADVQLIMAKVEAEMAKSVSMIADAKNEDAKTSLEPARLRLEEMKTLLEDERGRLELAVRESIARMARKPGDGRSA